VASLFPPCLGVGRGVGETLAGMMGERFPVDTERTVARDYGFPVRLRNPAGALLRPVWLCGVAGWCGCSARVAGLLFRKGGLPRWFPVGTVKSFGEPHSVGAM